MSRSGRRCKDESFLHFRFGVWFGEYGIKSDDMELQD
jgi:hypothetical protein